MRFEWDEDKRLRNLRKHGLDFRDAHLVFDQDTYTDVDERFDYGEQRIYTIGMIRGITVIVSHTETTEVIRIISFRKAKKDEQELFFKKIRD